MTEDTGHSNRDAASAERPTERPKLKRKGSEKKLRELQTELCSLQNWVKRTGQRIIVVFEGRDAAGKGGTVRALTERVSPRTFPEWSRFPRRQIARKPRCMGSDTLCISRQPVRS